MTPAERLSDERLAEIIKGCEGVTPGPWGEGDKWVFASPRSGNPSHEYGVGFINEGDMVVPVNQDDCTHWQPLPTPPSRGEGV